MLLTWAPLALADKDASAHPHANKAATGENNNTAPHEKGLTPYAPVLFYGIGGHPPTDPHDLSTAKYGPLAVTNSIFVAILVAAAHHVAEVWRRHG